MYAQERIHCDTCTDAAELMEMVRGKEYNLLLTDLNMPGINGFELLELLRSSNEMCIRDRVSILLRIIPRILTTRLFHSLSERSEPVSYTHLDVYKRQVVQYSKEERSYLLMSSLIKKR